MICFAPTHRCCKRNGRKWSLPSISMTPGSLTLTFMALDLATARHPRTLSLPILAVSPSTWITERRCVCGCP